MDQCRNSQLTTGISISYFSGGEEKHWTAVTLIDWPHRHTSIWSKVFSRAAGISVQAGYCSSKMNKCCRKRIQLSVRQHLVIGQQRPSEVSCRIL